MFRRGKKVTSTPGSAIEAAWRIHAVVVEWTRNVDAKASFVLGIESAVLAAVIVLTEERRALGSIEGSLALALFLTGVACLVLAIVVAALVVAPRLRSGRLRRESDVNFIYFGHLRHWRSDDLQNALTSQDLLPVLCRNAIAMSRIAWRKHRGVQISVLLAILGGSLVLLAAVTTRCL